MEIKKKENKIIKFQRKKNKCPTCRKPSNDLFTPFCSKKCGDLDLMKWLSDQSGFNIK